MSDRLKELAVVFVVLIILMPFFWGVLASPSKINCRVQEINIQTGQLRYSRYLYYIKISEKVQETVVSEFIDEPVEFRDVTPWWRINAFGPFRKVSPYYIFHTTVWGDIKTSSLDDKHKTEDEKRDIAVELLQKWQAKAYEVTSH